MVNVLRYYDETRTFSQINTSNLSFTNNSIPVTALNLASGSGTANNPAGTTSATFVMMGLGSNFTFTPASSPVVFIAVTCQIANSAANDISISRMQYGTGAAPVNGAAVTGTAVGQIQAIINNANTAGVSAPCTMIGLATGLTPGVQIWIDVALEIVTGGTATIIDPGLVIFEI